jgi:predicted nucleotidyltransferase
VNGIFEAALEIQGFFAERRWGFAIIGGVAAIRWGEPQATQDVDVCLLTGFGGESAFIKEILGQFAGRISDAERFALESRVLLLTASNGVPIDVALAGIPFEEQLIRRASDFEFLPGVRLRTCSAEDLIVLKAFAGRAKDWATVEGVLSRQKDVLDWAYVEKHLPPLCELKGEPEAVSRLAQLRRA